MPPDPTDAVASRLLLSNIRENLATAITAILGRLHQVTATETVSTLGQQWTALDGEVQRQLNIGVRIDTMFPKVEEYLQSSGRVLSFAERETELDVSTERTRFDTFRKDWDDFIQKYHVHRNKLIGLDQTPFPDPNDSRINSLEKRVSDLAAHFEAMGNTVEALNVTFDEKIAPHQARYKEFNDAYDAVRPAINERVEALDKLVRHQGEKVLAGRYEVDADNEEKAANGFRWAAIVVMVSIIVLIGCSYYELANFTLNPVQATIRIAFSFILSVPAAYLARESAKHRQRQYVLRQTALEIGAIDSYIKTLPSESQNKIKEEIAIKLFTPQKLDGFDKDSFPINTQELLTKLIDAIKDLKKEVIVKKDAKKDEE